MEELLAALSSTEPTGTQRLKLAAPRNAARALKTHAVQELQRIQAVSALPAYRSDPFSALQSHLAHAFPVPAPTDADSAPAASAADAAAAKSAGVQNMSTAPYVSRRRAAGGAPVAHRPKQGGGRGGGGSSGNGQDARGRVRRARGGGATGRAKSRSRS